MEYIYWPQFILKLSRLILEISNDFKLATPVRLIWVAIILGVTLNFVGKYTTSLTSLNSANPHCLMKGWCI